jgi:hypothetical protein
MILQNDMIQSIELTYIWFASGVWPFRGLVIYSPKNSTGFGSLLLYLALCNIHIIWISVFSAIGDTQEHRVVKGIHKNC